MEEEGGGEMMRVLLDTDDIRSSREGSGCMLSSTSDYRLGWWPVAPNAPFGDARLLSLFLAHPMNQDPSLRLVPAKQPVKASISDTANSLGLHDTLKYGPRTLVDEIKSTNPLQARLENVRHSMPCTITSLNRDCVTTVG